MPQSRLSKVNWLNRKSVIEFAKKLDKGMTVYKLPGRRNYNICHTVNEYRLGVQIEHVIYRTGLR